MNTFPVLATAADDAVLGAAIVLPDHPRIAPESRGSLFDSTEIEEALLLHVQALSDGERDEIERPIPAVREMIERAAAVTPRGDRRAARPGDLARPGDDRRRRRAPPGSSTRAPARRRPRCDGVTFRRGGRVRIRPGADADLHARMLDGRGGDDRADLHRLRRRAHLGVTVDDDPGQELMRETGRYLFFFAPEVEVIDR